MSKQVKILAVSAILILVIVLSIVFNQLGSQTHPLSEPSSTYTQDNKDVSETPYIVVYLSGEIKNPGVYKVVERTRLYQVITQAGGLTSKADQHTINLAQILTDELHIIIPSMTESTPNNANDSQETNDTISINEATKEDLESLPGIGAVTAQHIIDYRTTHGPFTNLDELLNVTNIGTSTYETIRPFIRL